MADDADRAQEQSEREQYHRSPPKAPGRCMACGGPNDRQWEGYAICHDCWEELSS